MRRGGWQGRADQGAGMDDEEGRGGTHMREIPGLAPRSWYAQDIFAPPWWEAHFVAARSFLEKICSGGDMVEIMTMDTTHGMGQLSYTLIPDLPV